MSTFPKPAPVLFRCTDCGGCCTGEPGTVRITDDEITALAQHLDTPRKKLFGPFVRPFPHHLRTEQAPAHGIKPDWSLTETPDGSCIFFKNNRCSIYPVRPTQCRTYPFWLQNLRNAQAWRETARACPGIGKGELYTSEQILDILDKSPI